VQGPWRYLYRAVDKYGETIDFLLTEHRVAYLLLADNVSRPLPSRPRRLTQPVMSPPHGFSAPRPPLLACI
jgi:transposase-like protein